MAKNVLFVYPNPFIHLDHDGVPAGACPCDMLEHVGLTTRKWVGAEIDRANTFHTEKLSEEEKYYRDPRQQTRFKFNFAEPAMLPATEYYKDRIRSGEILCADEKSARAAGVAFVDPKKSLAAAKAKARIDFRAQSGEEAEEFIDMHDAAIAAIGEKPSQFEVAKESE